MLHVASLCTSCWMLLRVVAQSLKPVKLFSQQLPANVGSVAMRSLRMVYKDLWAVSFPRCTAGPNIVGSCCIRLHTTANTYATTLNIVGPTMLGAVASRLHAASVSKLKAESLLPNLIDVAVLLKNKNGWHCLRFMSALNVYNDVSRQTGASFFFPWAIYRYVTANMKVIKTQSDPNPCYFPVGILGREV